CARRVGRVDRRRHRLEPLGDVAEAVLAETLWLDLERSRERGHDVVRGDGAIPVNEMVEVAGRESRTRRELAVRDALLVHQALDGLAEPLLPAPTTFGHHYPPFPH